MTASNGKPVEIERVDDVRGWRLVRVHGDPEIRFGHRSVARRLGYSDGKNLLQFAERVLGADWKVTAPYTTFRTGARGPLTRDYLLTQHEVLHLLMRSEAANAHAIQREVAAVATWRPSDIGVYRRSA